MGRATESTEGVDGWLVSVLGPCRLSRAPASDVVALTVLQSRLLARLALSAPREVPLGALVEALWDDRPPATARAALQNQVSRLRAKADDEVIETTPLGYRLRVGTDVEEFGARLDEAEHADVRGEPERRIELVESALASWRGNPYSELEHVADARVERARLLARRTTAEVRRLEAAIESGELGWAVPEAHRLVAVDDEDERCWALLVTALDAVGRRGDALGAAQRARGVLRQRLGLDAGRLLREAEARVLAGGETNHDGAAHRVPGRGDEVRTAVELLRAGRSVVIVGEDGSGKSDVLEVVVREISGDAAVAWSRCPEFPSSATTTLAALLDELGGTLDQTAGPVQGFVDAVQRVASRRPVVLAVDDVHLAGPTTERALVQCSQLEQVGVVATSLLDTTADHRPLPEVERVALGPFPDPAVDEFVRARMDGRQVSDAAVAWLSAMSGGNPLLLETLLSDPAVVEYLASGAEIPAGPSGDTFELPMSPGLADLVRRRLGRLGTATSRTLEVAAVCGPEFPTDLLAELATSAGLTGAQATGLLVGEGDVTRFRHGAVQRLVDADLAPGRRLELHYAVGQARSARGDPAAIVAPHLLVAVELDPAAAVAVARAAGADATNQGAHREAARWYAQAAEAARAMGPRGVRDFIVSEIGRGDALRLEGDPAHEAVLFEIAELAEEVDEPDLVAEATYALLQLGATTESGGLHDRAAALAARALDRIADGERHAVVAAAASLAHSMSGHPQRCRDLFLEAEGEARGDQARRKVLPFAYMALGHPADLDRRERLARELLDRSVHADDPVGLFEARHLLFSVALQQGDGRAVRHELAAAEELVDRVGDVGRRWSLAYMAAAVAHLDDRLDESERRAEQALELFSPVSPSRSFAVYGAQLLMLRLAQGRVAELAPVFEELVRDQPGVPAWHAALALALVEAAPSRSAEHARLALDDVPDDFTWLAAHLTGGRAAARTGDEYTAATYLERLAPYGHLICWQGNCAYGPVATVAAMLAAAQGDSAGAEAHAATARRLAERLEAPVFLRDLDDVLADGKVGDRT